MKKITKGWSKDYGSLKVFRDDIEEIAGIITSEGGWENKLEIRTDLSVLDNISELKNVKGNYLRRLEFTVGYGFLDLDLTPKWASLKVSNSDDTKLMGIATRIDTILQKRCRLLGYLNNKMGFVLSGLLWGIVLSFPTYNKIFVWFPTVLPIIALLAILDTVCIWYLWSHVSTICLYYSHEKSNFFSRNKDAIMVSAITAVFSVIGTLSVQAILTKSKDKATPPTSSAVTKEVNDISQKK
jgi:hypothetical protein